MKKRVKKLLVALTALGTLALAAFGVGCSSDKLDSELTQWACSHNYGKTATSITPATCESSGLEVWTCSKCSKEKEIVLPVTEHKKIKTVSKVEPTCTSVGYSAYTYCADCGSAVTEKKEIAKLSHDYEVVPAKNATCLMTGNTSGLCCTVCGRWSLESQVLPKVEHDTLIVIPAVSVSCGDGYTEGARCSMCNKITIEPERLEGTGNHLNIITKSAVAATCTKKGHTVGEYCTDCKTWLSGEEIDLLPHTSKDDECECRVCGEVVHTDIVVYDDEPPTCTNAGFAPIEKCNKCGEVISGGEVLGNLGHDYVDCVCTRCGRTSHEYEYSEPFVDRTVFTEGFTGVYECVDCGDVIEGEVIERGFDNSYFELLPRGDESEFVMWGYITSVADYTSFETDDVYYGFYITTVENYSKSPLNTVNVNSSTGVYSTTGESGKMKVLHLEVETLATDGVGTSARCYMSEGISQSVVTEAFGVGTQIIARQYVRRGNDYVWGKMYADNEYFYAISIPTMEGDKVQFEADFTGYNMTVSKPEIVMDGSFKIKWTVTYSNLVTYWTNENLSTYDVMGSYVIMPYETYVKYGKDLKGLQENAISYGDNVDPNSDWYIHMRTYDVDVETDAKQSDMDILMTVQMTLSENFRLDYKDGKVDETAKDTIRATTKLVCVGFLKWGDQIYLTEFEEDGEENAKSVVELVQDFYNENSANLTSTIKLYLYRYFGCKDETATV